MHHHLTHQLATRTSVSQPNLRNTESSGGPEKRKQKQQIQGQEASSPLSLARHPYHETLEKHWLRDCVWWKKGIIYQIYPRSFKDSNGDGVGDLQGVLQKLDYLQWLGVTAIWLSPIFPSPMKDFGYDISDYRDIHPLFGTMQDFEELLEDVHSRGMKLMLDLVPNHTSDEHPFFIRARDEGKDGPMRDWYIWRDPKVGGGPPNNWRSVFGGPAWTFDKTSGQYYLHQFHTGQPELNYRNPKVLEWMLENMRFWLRKGVDGFRVDVIWLLMKDVELRDEPVNHEWDGVNPFEELKHIHSQNVEGIHDIIRDMRKVCDEFDEKLMVGEIYLPYSELMKYVGEQLDECHLPFNFKLITIKWSAVNVRHFVNEYEALLPLGSWPNWVLGNHDQPRVATRIGLEQARVANMLLLTLRGTPTTYNGEEIGMLNGEVPFELMVDPQGVNNPELSSVLSRDFQRTPMQWDGSENAGFTEDGAKPWLPVAKNARTLNVSNQEEDPSSMLHLFRALTMIRSLEPSLSIGHYRCVAFEAEKTQESLFCYLRQAHIDSHPHHSKGIAVPGSPFDPKEEYSDAESDDEETTIFARNSQYYPDSFFVVLNFTSETFVLDVFEKLKGQVSSTSLTGEINLSPIGQLELSTNMSVPQLSAIQQKRGIKALNLKKLEINPNEGLLIRLRQDRE